MITVNNRKPSNTGCQNKVVAFLVSANPGYIRIHESYISHQHFLQNMSYYIELTVMSGGGGDGGWVTAQGDGCQASDFIQEAAVCVQCGEINTNLDH